VSELVAAFGLRSSLSEAHAAGHLDPLTVDPAALGREQSPISPQVFECSRWA